MSLTTAHTTLPTGTWSVDPVRSHVGFAVKQFGLAPVRGSFGRFDGTLEIGDDLADVRMRGAASVASLDTKQRRRDAHLISPDFLDAERFPQVTFESREMRPLGARAFEIAGDLTIHGTTRPITLTAERTDAEDAAGDPCVALAVRGRLDRRDFGVTPSRVLDMVVASEVELQLDISALAA